jgi:hypothetical protein
MLEGKAEGNFGTVPTRCLSFFIIGYFLCIRPDHDYILNVSYIKKWYSKLTRMISARSLEIFKNSTIRIYCDSYAASGVQFKQIEVTFLLFSLVVYLINFDVPCWTFICLITGRESQDV